MRGLSEGDSVDAEQRKAALQALGKLIAIAAVLGGIAVAGAFALVHVLGLNKGTAAKPVDTPGGGQSTLPTSALPTGNSSDSPSPSETPSQSTPPKQKLQLTMAPLTVRGGQRIQISGSYPNKNGVTLQVQRFENGAWTSFAGVTVGVHGGTFSSYVLTSRTGPNKFRVFDPATGKGSNPVTVTVQ